MRFVLASGSPRRRELLRAMGYDFEAILSSVDEEAFTAARPEALVRRLARAKAENVASHNPGGVVLAADTIVVLRGRVLNKPADAAEAREMLASLRDRQHGVITAVCVTGAGKRIRVQHTVTRVTMRPYAPREVEASIARGDPFDKAGGYAIQDPVFAPVAAYDGCYCNVVGLPLWVTARLLQGVGIALPAGGEMPAACATCPLALVD